MELKTSVSLPSKACLAETSGRQQMIEFISSNATPLLGSLRSYVRRMGLASGEEVVPVAMEVLQEVVLEALDHADRFHSTARPMPWLLGIGANVIKRKKVEMAKHARREVSIGAIASTQAESLHDDEMFEYISKDKYSSPEQEFIAKEQATWLLSLVNAEDQNILLLAFLCGFEREALAKRLGVTSGAARVRLHRALQRLRQALTEIQYEPLERSK